MVISTACCREDGHSDSIVPTQFPAVADPRLVCELADTSKKLGFNNVHTGVTLTSNNFYPSPAIAGTLQVNADAGALSVEMENATLFCVATIRGIRAASICTIDGSPFQWEEGNYDPLGKAVSEGKNQMIKVGLTVGAKVSKETSEKDDVKQKNIIESMQKIFSEQEANGHLKTFKELNMFDFVMSQDALKIDQKAKIFAMTLDGFASVLQFYLENESELSEEII